MKNFKTLFFLLLSTHFIHAQISGTVFLDFNANGQKDNSASFNEVGYQGITVTAFDASGAVVGIPATTDANGDYTIAGVTGQLRVEFTWTDNWLFPSASGSTSVQFVTAPITNIDLGVHYPEEHWDNINQTNPMFLIPCFADGNTTIGPNSGDDAVVTFKNNDTGLTFTKGQVAIHSEIGALWGVAFQKTADRYFSSAFLKRHVGLGDKGLGGVYIFDTDATDYDLTGSFDLNGVSPSNGGATLDFGAVTRVISPGGNDNYLGSGGASRDMDAYGKVGTVGFGDINFGPDGKLYLVNLFQKSIIVVDVSGTTVSLDGASTASLNALTEAYSITAQTGVPTCANGELRPFALTF
ncbi:MAG: SdrD B-like domain-containing protein, partial [Chitinophagales bacterium]